MFETIYPEEEQRFLLIGRIILSLSSFALLTKE